MSGYKAAAGFAIDSLNKAPRTIAAGAQAFGSPLHIASNK
jgi:hypothetical protein